MVEKRKPSFAPLPVQYYDYEEQVPTTQRPVQLARPKYSAPQFVPQQQQRQQQFENEGGVVYAPESRATAPQYQQFDNRQPLQFPTENASPAPRPAEQFSLFSPAAQRSDSSKVRLTISNRTYKLRKLLNRNLKKWKIFKKKLLKRLKRNKKVLYFVKKKRSFFV